MRRCLGHSGIDPRGRSAYPVRRLPVRVRARYDAPMRILRAVSVSVAALLLLASAIGVAAHGDPVWSSKTALRGGRATADRLVYMDAVEARGLSRSPLT